MYRKSNSEIEFVAAQEKVFAAISNGDAVGSTVPTRDSYGDAATCLSVVAFPSTAVAARIHDQVIAPLAAIDRQHHYYSPETLHVTVKSIRTAATPRGFSDRDIQVASDVLREVTPSLPIFDFELSGLARFPSSIVIRAFATVSFREAVHMLDRALQRAGIVDNKVYASNDVLFGNLTLCRFTAAPSTKLLGQLASFQETCFGRMTPNALHLISCDEVCSSESRQTHAMVKIDAS